MELTVALVTVKFILKFKLPKLKISMQYTVYMIENKINQKIK